MGRFKVWIDNTSTDNVMTYEEFDSDLERTNGFKPGTMAKSKTVNSALRQANLVTSAFMELYLPSSTLDLTSSLDSMLTDLRSAVLTNLKNGSGEKSVQANTTSATGKQSVTLGSNTSTYGDYSFAIGDSSSAYGKTSFASGKSCVAFGHGCHAEGISTTAGNMGSSEPDQEGEAAHTEGKSTYAYGTASHAEGESCGARGNCSHAEGYNCQANAYAAHAQGNSCIANGQQSFAGGHSSTTSGDNSFVYGSSLTANEANVAVFGRYNRNVSNALFVVGNGNSSNRSNAMEVFDGGEIRAGKMFSLDRQIKCSNPMSTPASSASFSGMDMFEPTSSLGSTTILLFGQIESKYIADVVKLTRDSETTSMHGSMAYDNTSMSINVTMISGNWTMTFTRDDTSAQLNVGSVSIVVLRVT